VKEAVFQMEHNKAPGPDGFPTEFFQIFLGNNKGGPYGTLQIFP